MPDEAPDRTEVSPGIWVGGRDAEVGFVGTVIDVREEQPTDPRVVHIPAFESVRDGWRVRPVKQSWRPRRWPKCFSKVGPYLYAAEAGLNDFRRFVALFYVRYEFNEVSEAYARVRAARPQIQEAFDLLPLSYEERTR